MIGTTFIAETDPSRIARLTSLDDIDNFPHVYMDRMLTLDFEMLASAAGVPWSEEPPVVLDDACGWAVFKINAAALRHILNNIAGAEPMHADDLHKLAEFVRNNEGSDFYESATF